jgi:ribulose-5-phosphate 4-epimerase/fuculose-1-phosphate aldolase
MITQDSLRFYKSHSVYDDFGGIVLDREEGIRIAQKLGQGKACILQNHGLLTVGQSVDEAAFWFMSLDKTCHAQLLVDAASAGSGHKKIFIKEAEAAFTYEQVGGKSCLILKMRCQRLMMCRADERLVSFPRVL